MIVCDKYNANNSVIIAIIAIIYDEKNKWNNRCVISEIIVFLESSNTAWLYDVENLLSPTASKLFSTS